MRNLLSLLTFLFIFVLVTPVKADLVSPGKKGLNPCVSLTNLKDYSNYKFILFASGVNPDLTLIKEGECHTWYKFNTEIYVVAVPSDKFNDSLLEGNDTTNLEAIEGTAKTEKLPVSEYTEVSVADSRNQVEDKFEIASISDKVLELNKLTTTQAAVLSWPVVISLGILVLIGFGLLLWIKRAQHKK